MGTLHVELAYPTGASIGYSVKRMVDGLLLDHADGTFKASPGTLIDDVTEGTGDEAGSYTAEFTTDPAQFTDGDYVIRFHDQDSANLIIAKAGVAFYGGDDATVFPEPGDGVSAGSIAVAVLAAAVEAGVDVKGALALAAAGAAGKLSGATGEASTITIKGAGTDTDRIVAAVDGAGNRTSVTLNLP